MIKKSIAAGLASLLMVGTFSSVAATDVELRG